MAEDWRVTVTLEAASAASHLLLALPEHELEEDTRRRLGDRVAVSGSGDQVFLYADSADSAREAEKVVSDVLAAHGLQGTLRLERWHHQEEEWVDARVPLPAAGGEEAAEHARLEQQETAESEDSGIADWEVRIEFASHHDARAFEQRLEREGYGHFVRRWTYVLIGTDDHDDAERVARDLRGELPAGASLQVEPGSGLAWKLMPGDPFAIFGGLGG